MTIMNGPAGRPKRIVVGASGIPFAVRVLDLLADIGEERHLVISPAGKRTAAFETPTVRMDDHAEFVYPWRDVGATIASGSFPVDGMIVVPCSVKTLAAIASGVGDNLLARAADVTLKERRRLVVSVRESPLHLGYGHGH